MKRNYSAIGKHPGFRATYSSRRRIYIHVGSASASMQKTLLEQVAQNPPLDSVLRPS